MDLIRSCTRRYQELVDVDDRIQTRHRPQRRDAPGSVSVELLRPFHWPEAKQASSMQRTRLCAIGVIAALLLPWNVGSALAIPLTPLSPGGSGATPLPGGRGGLARFPKRHLLLQGTAKLCPRLQRKLRVPGRSAPGRLSPLAARVAVTRRPPGRGRRCYWRLAASAQLKRQMRELGIAF